MVANVVVFISFGGDGFFRSVHPGGQVEANQLERDGIAVLLKVHLMRRKRWAAKSDQGCLKPFRTDGGTDVAMMGRATVGSLSLPELLFPISFSSQQSVAIVCGSWALLLRDESFF